MNNGQTKRTKRLLAATLSALVLGTPVVSYVLNRIDSKSNNPKEIVQMDDVNEKKWHPTDAFVFEVPYNGGKKANLYFRDGHKIALYDIKDPEIVDDVPVWINCGDLFLNLFGWSKSDIENTTLSEQILAKLSIDGMYAFEMQDPDYDLELYYENPDFMSTEYFDKLTEREMNEINESSPGPRL